MQFNISFRLLQAHWLVIVIRISPNLRLQIFCWIFIVFWWSPWPVPLVKVVSFSLVVRRRDTVWCRNGNRRKSTSNHQVGGIKNVLTSVVFSQNIIKHLVSSILTVAGQSCLPSCTDRLRLGEWSDRVLPCFLLEFYLIFISGNKAFCISFMFINEFNSRKNIMERSFCNIT